MIDTVTSCQVAINPGPAPEQQFKRCKHCCSQAAGCVSAIALEPGAAPYRLPRLEIGCVGKRPCSTVRRMRIGSQQRVNRLAVEEKYNAVMAVTSQMIDGLGASIGS